MGLRIQSVCHRFGIDASAARVPIAGIVYSSGGAVSHPSGAKEIPSALFPGRGSGPSGWGFRQPLNVLDNYVAYHPHPDELDGVRA
jgi:hypothetical protein